MAIGFNGQTREIGETVCCKPHRVVRVCRYHHRRPTREDLTGNCGSWEIVRGETCARSVCYRGRRIGAVNQDAEVSQRRNARVVHI